MCHLVLGQEEVGRQDGVFGSLQVTGGALVDDDEQSHITHDVQLL